jgi:hypothetical protein
MPELHKRSIAELRIERHAEGYGYTRFTGHGH